MSETVTIKHKPVLMDEVLHYLNPQPNKVYVDVTLGGGGHTKAILDLEPTCTVIGMDWDLSVIESTGKRLKEEYPDRFIPLWGNFSKINQILHKNGYHKVDGVLADFGTSQIQIATTPGLSFSRDDFLDMRMSNSFFKTTAYDLLKKLNENELAQIFYDYGQERYGRKIAKAIVEDRKNGYMKTTKQLAKLVESVVPYNKKSKIHPATKVFQALRIVVNKELENIQSFLINSLKVLAPEGRLVCISFHSLEDRLVKQFFKNELRVRSDKMELLTTKVCVAGEDELMINRSARSAKLRAAKF